MNLTLRYAYPIIFFTIFPFPVGMALAEGVQPSGSLSLGHRVDSLDWNISGGSGGPNVLSELEWNDMDILQVRGALSGGIGAGLYFRGLADYGWVWDGQSRDSDYAGDNRTLEFSRSTSDADGGRVVDLSGGLGLIFSAGEARQWQIIPMVGYSYHRQDLRTRNGNQQLSNLANAQIFDPTITALPTLGPFPGLNTHYDASWYGPWLGADIFLGLRKGGVVFARLQAHWVNFSAEANWNLRTDFAHPVSFTHDANGRGGMVELGWQSTPRSSWMWGVSVNLQSWTTGSGIDRTFFAGGGSGVTKLNEVNWSSRGVNFTLQKAFAH